MLSGDRVVPLDADLQAATLRGVTFRAAVVAQATRDDWSQRANYAYLRLRGARAGLSPEEVDAGIAEGLLSGLLVTSGGWYWTPSRT